MINGGMTVLWIGFVLLVLVLPLVLQLLILALGIFQWFDQSGTTRLPAPFGCGSCTQVMSQMKIQPKRR